MAFDLLHDGFTALTEKPLSERLELLRNAVVQREPGGPCQRRETRTGLVEPACGVREGRVLQREPGGR